MKDNLQFGFGYNNASDFVRDEKYYKPNGFQIYEQKDANFIAGVNNNRSHQLNLGWQKHQMFIPEQQQHKVNSKVLLQNLQNHDKVIYNSQRNQQSDPFFQFTESKQKFKQQQNYLDLRVKKPNQIREQENPYFDNGNRKDFVQKEQDTVESEQLLIQKLKNYEQIILQQNETIRSLKQLLAQK